jgi:hypothetical protein
LTAIHPSRFPAIPDGSELDRDLAKRERRRVRMSTETRRLTGVGRGIILPARLRLRCCSGEKEVDAGRERSQTDAGRERSQTDAARRGVKRARRRFASPLTGGARGAVEGALEGGAPPGEKRVVVAAGGRGREEEAGGADLRRRQRWERRLCEVGFQ